MKYYTQCEEILTAYPVFLAKFKQILMNLFCFDHLFSVESRFNWGNTKTQFILVSQNRNGCVLAGYRKEKSAIVSSLLLMFKHKIIIDKSVKINFEKKNNNKNAK